MVGSASSPLPLAAVIYRAIRTKKWVDGNITSSAAFVLRSGEEELSVLTAANCSREVCAAAGFLKKCYGEIVLSVAAIRECGLDVIHDPKPGIPDHASIINLPPHEGETFAEAEHIAGQLAKRVQEVRPRPK